MILTYEVRTSEGEAVLRSTNCDYRADSGLPEGDYEQYLSLDGGLTWGDRPLYLRCEHGRLSVKGCSGTTERGHGFKVPCGLALGHAGPCS